jgi:hypothetical protein
MRQKQLQEKGAAVAPAVPLVAAPMVAPPVATVEPQTVPLVVTEPQATPAPPPAKAAPSVPAAAVEATAPEASPSHHPSGWAIGLGSATIAATAVAAVGAGFIIDYKNYGLVPPPNSNDGAVYMTKRNRAQTWQVITPIAAGVAAACLVGTVLTW